jgi:hypothetical protein
MASSLTAKPSVRLAKSCYGANPAVRARSSMLPAPLKRDCCELGEPLAPEGGVGLSATPVLAVASNEVRRVD